MMKTFPDTADLYPDDPLSLDNQSGIRIPADESLFSKLMQIVELHEPVRFRHIELVFVDENEILRINREYLNHDFITDIITFSYSDSPEEVEGTLFCCAPRIVEQSAEFETDTAEEFLRVFVHGLIHLSGYDDGTEAEKSEMTRLENRYLELLEKDS